MTDYLTFVHLNGNVRGNNLCHIDNYKVKVQGKFKNRVPKLKSTGKGNNTKFLFLQLLLNILRNN